MKVLGNLLHPDKVNILWGLGIEGEAELFLIPRLGEIKMDDLPEGMDTCICPACSMYGHRIALIETHQGLLDFFLHTTGMRLALETRK